jgi:hypothetical protein
MRSIAIIGAGQAGLLTAHDLVRHGYQVTLYSDKTPEDFLTKARPTGTAARFDMALDYERELGLNFWEKDAPKGEGIHLTFSPAKGNRLLTLVGRFKKYFLAIDLRLQSSRWMTELEKKGGKVEIENVTVDRLEQIAGDHDLTIVAAGRGDIQTLFPRDEARSVYTKPQRKLCMICTKGQPFAFPGTDVLPVKFNFFAKYGEAFWVPWFHKDIGPSWSMLFEAKAGGPLDRFDGVTNGHEAVDMGREVIKDLMPWDYEWCRNMELLDENSWLKGGFTPEVREVVGTLPSGRKVMSVGDTTMSLDPIGGQGANNGNKMARNLVTCIVERGEEPYDEAWMASTFERFWQRHHLINDFNNALLEPITNAGKQLLIAQYGSTGAAGDTPGPQAIANLFCENFDDPASLSPAFFDAKTAHKVIAQATGRPWWRAVLRGGLKVAKGQIRQKLGLNPHHPGTVS